ncbi:NACHT domain-containing protein [Arcticibacter tournemirensis]|uniref:NACHT domain-containing protein n=1 Tax=Arcticibacter tournemirensis TaxID=699437 RepID=A0A4Q0MBK4_9SPHI|nr:NACHT domain-containing protein [Arcticibacter tournemirensis]RXF70535.1 NACHT domain-containing protein [Arcticibacter tournemirensis]
MDELKAKIKEELGLLPTTYPLIFSDKIIDLFFDILKKPWSNPSVSLEGLQNRVPNAMSKILIENINKEDRFSFFPEVAKIEPFLKKIVFLLDEQKFNEIESSRSGLAKSIDFLNLNPSNLRLSTTKPEDVANSSDPFIVHVLRSYHLRNIESHLCKNWTNKELYENLESVLIVYLYTVYLHATKLTQIVTPEPKFDVYLESVISAFEIWRERFVHITGIESFDEIPIHAIEREDWNNKEKNVLRSGKIDDLRKVIDENSMVILGEPGMGKSTTMQYMTYNDAKSLISGSNPSASNKLPIYIELKLLSKEESIIDYCCQRLEVSATQLLEYFKNGTASLFLDGLNEVYNELRKPVRSEIQKLISTYKNLFIIITARPLAYSNEFKDTPVFTLQRLDDLQVKEFLEKNCSDTYIRTVLMNEILSSSRLGKIVRVPLLLKMLVNVVLGNAGAIPENKTQIISHFIKNLYLRERDKLIETVDLRIVHRLLCFLGHSTRSLNASNVGWRIEQFESIVENKIERSQFKINVYEFIDIAVDLHILVKDGDKYSFIHELYQEYFASEEFFRLNAIST